MTVETVRPVDKSPYVYDIEEENLRRICYFIDQDGVWERAARFMGYSEDNIIEFKHLSTIKQESPTNILISHWGDQNHTCTELFMVLYHFQQFSAMEYLRKKVDKIYHYLILKTPAKLDEMLTNSMFISKNSSNATVINDEEHKTHPTDIDPQFPFPKIDKIAALMRSISYSELLLATNNWSSEVLGKGGFGFVYKGIWKNTEVAIKKIAYQKEDTAKEKKIQIEVTQSMNELKFLNQCRHDNILPLYGFSNDGPEPCLVYQYMAGGSLQRRLRRLNPMEAPLTFDRRKLIAIGIARGLQYLHTFTDKPLIHGDIKPANILLDEYLVPKIGDFGLVREGSVESMAVSGAYGTRGYMASELCKHLLLSVKVDTYSYGVLLFELMTGLRVVNKEVYGENVLLAKYMWIQFIERDPNFQNIRNFVDKTMEINDQSFPAFEYFIRMGLVCTNENLSVRPNMVFVLEKLIEGLKMYNPTS